jgi:hypothetical protein
MTVIQISKIKVRRNVHTLLPGAPTIPGNAGTLTPGLDAGEFGFATDTGGLFIGAGSSFPQTSARTDFPYQNLEVLTEASPLTQPLVLRVTTFGDAPVATATPTATGIIIPATYDGTNFGNGVSIKYTLIEVGTTHPPTRYGQMRIVGDGSVASMSDSFVTTTTMNVAFTAVVVGNTIVVKLTNNEGSPTNFRLMYRIS